MLLNTPVGGSPSHLTTIEPALYILDQNDGIRRHLSVIAVVRKIEVSVKRSGTVHLSTRRWSGRSKRSARIFSKMQIFSMSNKQNNTSTSLGATSVRDIDVASDPQERGPSRVWPLPTADALPATAVILQSQECEPSPTEARHKVPQSRDAVSVAPIQTMVAKVKYVQQILQLLHLAKSVLLIEFMEVVISVIYCGYFVSASNLPNRDYYALFKGVEDHEIRSKIGDVLLYTLLEFASFVMLATTLQYKTRVPIFHQVGFAIESQWGHVQAKILVWVVFTIQLPLEHFGTVYPLLCYQPDWDTERRRSDVQVRVDEENLNGLPIQSYKDETEELLWRDRCGLPLTTVAQVEDVQSPKLRRNTGTCIGSRIWMNPGLSLSRVDGRNSVRFQVSGYT